MAAKETVTGFAFTYTSFNDFQAWWACYEAESHDEPALSTKSVALDAWLAAIKLIEVKLTANNSAMPKLPGFDTLEKFIDVEYMDASINEKVKILAIASRLYEFIAGLLRKAANVGRNKLPTIL